MSHMSGFNFLPGAFLITVLNLVIVIGIIFFVPYILFNINRRLGQIANLMEELVREKRRD